jgi:hypothetical protein
MIFLANSLTADVTPVSGLLFPDFSLPADVATNAAALVGLGTPEPASSETRLGKK